VRKFRFNDPETRSSASCDTGHGQNVAQVRYYAQGARTTSALRQRARQRGNVVIDNAFASHPGFSI